MNPRRFVPLAPPSLPPASGITDSVAPWPTRQSLDRSQGSSARLTTKWPPRCLAQSSTSPTQLNWSPSERWAGPWVNSYIPALDSTFSPSKRSLLLGISPPTCVWPRLMTTLRFDQRRQISESLSELSATDTTAVARAPVRRPYRAALRRTFAVLAASSDQNTSAFAEQTDNLHVRRYRAAST